MAAIPRRRCITHRTFTLLSKCAHMRQDLFYFVPKRIFPHFRDSDDYCPVPIVFTIYPARYPLRHGYQETAFLQRFVAELLVGEAIALKPPFIYSIATTQRHLLDAANELGFVLKSYPNPHLIIAIRIR